MARDISVYQRELTRQQDRSTRQRRGGNDFQWFSPAKPSRVGERTRTQVRILPRPAEAGSDEEYADEWWVTADQHVLTVDGRTRVFNCPDDHDNRDGPQICPLCTLRREMYREKTPAAQELARDLKVRSRAFAVIACPDGDHEKGPFVWGFSTSLLNSIMEIAVAKRCMVDDPDTGRDLLVTVNRIGPKRYDIRYSVTDMDASEVDGDLRSMIEQVPDLTSLTKDASMDDLRELAALLDPRPGGKRASSNSGSTPAYNSPDPSPAPPRREPQVVRDVDTSFHYSGTGGDQSGLDVAAVARLVADNEGDDHYVWREGWEGWKPAAEVAEIAAAVKALKPPPAVTPPAPPAGIPKPPAAPPQPPKPPGGSAF